MMSIRTILISALLHLCMISAGHVSAQSFDAGLQHYLNEQFEEASEIFSVIDDDRGALFAGKSELALSNVQDAEEYLTRATQSSSLVIRQEAEFTLAMVHYRKGDHHLALPLLHSLADTQSPAGVQLFADRFYRQILGYLTGRQRVGLLHQIDSPAIRYDLFHYAVDVIPNEELVDLGNELLRLAPNSRDRNRIESALASVRRSPDDLNQFPNVPDGTVYNIGVILPVFPVDDPDFEIPRNLYMGIVLAADEFNSRNVDRKIHLNFKDSHERNDSSIVAMESLILETSADAVIGPLFSEQAASIAPISDRYETPLIIPLANSSRLSDEFTYSYQINPSPQAHARVMAQFATEVLGYQRLGVITESGTQGSQFARTFRQHSEQKGATITRFVDQNFAASGYDLTGISSGFYGSEPEGETEGDPELSASYTQAVYAPFTGQSATTMMNLLLNDMESSRNFIPILGSEDWKFGTISDYQHQNLEIFYTEAGTTNREMVAGEMSQFTEEYVTRFGIEPDQFSTLGYDVGSYLFTALETAGNPLYLDRVLQQENRYEGLSIQIDMDEGRVNQHLFVRPLTQRAEQLLDSIHGLPEPGPGDESEQEEPSGIDEF